MFNYYRWPATFVVAAGILTFALSASAQGQGGPGGQAPTAPGAAAPGMPGMGGRGGGGRGGRAQVTGPWSDKTLSPDKRADLVMEIGRASCRERVQLSV